MTHEMIEHYEKLADYYDKLAKKDEREVLERYAKEKRCIWCFHVDEGDGACKVCKNKSLWNEDWRGDRDEDRSDRC